MILTVAYRVVSAQRDKRTVELRMSDIQSMYQNHGISDAVIDFYTRYNIAVIYIISN